MSESKFPKLEKDINKKNEYKYQIRLANRMKDESKGLSKEIENIRLTK